MDLLEQFKRYFVTKKKDEHALFEELKKKFTRANDLIHVGERHVRQPAVLTEGHGARRSSADDLRAVWRRIQRNRRGIHTRASGRELEDRERRRFAPIKSGRGKVRLACRLPKRCVR